MAKARRAFGAGSRSTKPRMERSHWRKPVELHVQNKRSIIYYMNNPHSSGKYIRKLTKIAGHSIGLTLPISLVRSLRWRERQKVVVKRVGKRKIVIEDWAP